MILDEWMPREDWDKLVQGDGCPMCRELDAHEQSNKFGYTVAELPMSVLRLSVNQFSPGYCILICKQHVREPYELPSVERAQYWEDMMRVGQALEHVFNPIKINFQLLGNNLPHTHCHIIPRYYGDARPGQPCEPLIQEQKLESEAAYLSQVIKIQKALGIHII